MKLNYTGNVDNGCAFGFFMLWLLMIGSWVANIVKLVGIINDPVSGMMILRAVGIPVAPLGAILGWC